VKQRLWRLRLRDGCKCSPGSAVASQEGQKLGAITSVADVDGTAFALAYLRCKLDGQSVNWAGKQVDVEGSFAKVGPKL
jgi:hypothetical protein